MKTVEEQERLIRKARLITNYGDVIEKIRQSDLPDADRQDMERVILTDDNKTALELYWNLDTVIRDHFIGTIEDALPTAEKHYRADLWRMHDDAMCIVGIANELLEQTSRADWGMAGTANYYAAKVEDVKKQIENYARRIMPEI